MNEIYEREGQTYRALTSGRPALADYIVRRDSDGRCGGYIADLAADGGRAPERRFEAYDAYGKYIACAQSLRGALSVFGRPSIRWVQDQAMAAGETGGNPGGISAPRPATGGTTTMTNATGETTTYKAWTEWADDAIGQLDGLHNELDTWCVQIAADDGDQSQVEAIRRWQSDIEAVATEGRQMVAGVATTQVPVGEAVAAAGGSGNTPHKEYADEARPR